MADQVLAIDDVAIVTEPSQKPAYSQHGYVIDGNAKVYALTSRFFHGVALAILNPKLAADSGYEPPSRGEDDDFVDVFKYQRFEYDHCKALPVLRIACSQLTGATMVSYGNPAVSPAQLAALSAVFAARGLKANDTLTGDEDDMTVAQYMEYLRTRPAVDDKPDDHSGGTA